MGKKAAKKVTIELAILLAQARLARDAALEIANNVEAFAKLDESSRHSVIQMRFIDLFERSVEGLQTAATEIKTTLAKLEAGIETAHRKAAQVLAKEATKQPKK